MEELKKIFATATFRQSLITFSGTVLNGLLGAVFYVLAARALGPVSFGLLIIAITMLTLIADIAGLGTDTGLVRFIGKYSTSDPIKVKRFLKLGLEVKIFVWILVLILGLILAPFIATNIFIKPELSSPLRLSFIGVGASLLFSYIIHTLQGFQRFWSWSGIQIGTNTLRVLIIVALVISGNIGLVNTLGSYLITPFLGFVFGLFLLPKNFFRVKEEFSVVKEFFHYNKWVASFAIISATSARLDTFFLARLLPVREVGYYSAATQITTVVPQIVVAIGTVIAPKMASMGKIKDLVIYLKKTQLLVLGLAFLGIISIPFVIFLIPSLYGEEYIPAILPFVIHFLAMLIFLISVPVHNAVIYYFGKPSLFFWISLFNLMIVILLGWNLISSYGAVGAAATVLVSTIFNFIVPTLWVIPKMRGLRKSS